MLKKRKLYFHKKSGNLAHATKSEARKLGPEWEKIEFTKNEQGESVMRFKFDNATVDVMPNDAEGIKNVKRVTN